MCQVSCCLFSILLPLREADLWRGFYWPFLSEFQLAHRTYKQEAVGGECVLMVPACSVTVIWLLLHVIMVFVGQSFLCVYFGITPLLQVYYLHIFCVIFLNPVLLFI